MPCRIDVEWLRSRSLRLAGAQRAVYLHCRLHTAREAVGRACNRRRAERGREAFAEEVGAEVRSGEGGRGEARLIAARRGATSFWVRETS
jgi:hypothetical protein